MLGLLGVQGGHLVLREPGLVFEMQPGEVLLFDSTLFTHFNMRYTGRRMSVVLISDADLQNARSHADRMLAHGYGL